ncbi:unnamed protein product [Chrysoparadoxa australica]
MGLMALPEWNNTEAAQHINEDLINLGVSRVEIGSEEEQPFLKQLLHWLYQYSLRGCMRSKIGKVLLQYIRRPSRHSHIGVLLDVLGYIIKELAPSHSLPPHSQCSATFSQVLLPLHEPNEMVEWRDQIPLLQLYHKELAFCEICFIAHDKALAVNCILAILKVWPEGYNSNTPKEVLLLHELEELLQYVTPEEYPKVSAVVHPRLLECMSLENSRVVEKTLMLWRNPHFLQLIKSQSKAITKPALKVLLRGGKPYWNPTVNKMAAQVMRELEKADPAAFLDACTSLWPTPAGPAGAGSPSSSSSQPAGGRSSAAAPRGSGFGARVVTERQHHPRELDKRGAPLHSLKGDSRGWRPGQKGPVPSTVTGVAPWAFSASSQGRGAAGALKRPLPPSSHNSSSKSKGMQAMLLDEATEEEEREEPEQEPGDKASSATGNGTAAAAALERVHEFIELLSPAASMGDKTPWLKEQLNPTPTLLPTLKFHDLVFGKDLGSGSFSDVRYARQIIRGKPQDQWPEYAAKIISAEKIASLNYELRVGNEIAVLQLLSHPNIARLVSSFRWRGGAHLILEYASRGDLQGLLAHGPLDENAVRFVMGEVVAGVLSLHNEGFVYGDLKVENILVTEAGHIKLTDFGACRPVTAEAKALLRRSKDLVKKLRDGDWRAKTTEAVAVEPGMGDEGEVQEDEEEEGEKEDDDTRIEGTPAYLSPEILGGGWPSYQSDAWATGCVLFYCLAGMNGGHIPLTPIHTAQLPSWPTNYFLRASLLPLNLPSSVSADAVALISSLLKANPEQRLCLASTAQHSFFLSTYASIFTLHEMEPVELPRHEGAPKAQAGSAWTRRQNSMIWAPLPQKFDFESSRGAATAVGNGKEAQAGTEWPQMIEEMAEEARHSFLPPQGSSARIPGARVPIPERP